MKFEGTETIYKYSMTQSEMLFLTGILSTLDKEENCKVDDKDSKEMVKKLLKGITNNA